LQGSQVKAGEQFQLYNDLLGKARREVLRMADDEDLTLGRSQTEREWDSGFPRMPEGWGVGRPWGYN
jgi:hypothetical protein